MLYTCSLQFCPENSSPVGLAYTILIYNIVMPWLVTVFFEYRVLPQERMAEQNIPLVTLQHSNSGIIVALVSKNIERLNETAPDDMESVVSPSIHRWAAAVARSTYTASIYASPRGSVIDDEEPLLPTRKLSNYGSTEAPFDVAALLIQASKVRNDAWNAYENAVWDSCSNSSLSSPSEFTPQISSACVPGFRPKLFRVEGFIPAPPRMIFNDLVHGVEFSPHWNPTIASARYLQTFQSENLDIVHTMSKDVLGGLIKPRNLERTLVSPPTLDRHAVRKRTFTAFERINRVHSQSALGEVRHVSSTHSVATSSTPQVKTG
ncbi:unnamed protein product [Dibothriocephalus latus]|uniref:START domain-containing protein n=1 Tax=Dibothriocephalus latus TaxID=60516 RepID=A0A3P7LGH3_DIBLA|nr:unnamed protein product [Dibothriocephalus latus]